MTVRVQPEAMEGRVVLFTRAGHSRRGRANCLWVILKELSSKNWILEMVIRREDQVGCVNLGDIRMWMRFIVVL